MAAEVKNEASDSIKSDKAKKKSNRGCFIFAIFGCGLLVLLFGGLVALFAGLIMYGSSASGSIGEDVLYEGYGGKIAVIDIDGAIVSETNESSILGTSGVTPDFVREALAKAVADEDVRGILIRMDSPGGEVVASDLIYRKVVEASEEKPVVTWMSGMGASGGYLIAVGSDRIIAHPAAITGSIGVILELTNLEGLYEKLGIESRIFKSGEFKDDSGIFDEDPDGEADQVMQGIVDEAYEDFVDVIAEGRDMTLDEVRELADGRVYTGIQAAENGLIDGTGAFDDAVDTLEELIGETGLSVVEYSSGGFWSNLYEYEQTFLDKIGVLPVDQGVSVRAYYLLNM